MPDSQNSYKIWLIQGVLVALAFVSALVAVGAIWSFVNIEEIKMVDHIYNGFVVATWANIASLFAGFSIGLTALFSVGKDDKINMNLLGFAFTNFLIIGALWWNGAFKMRDNEPPSMTEKVLDFLDKNEAID